ncbi:MAG: glycoside hydrolase, partial [Actinobacteria bacterium]|nr:glycoside hydrolase [Actinomycetota bacterium]
MCHVTVSKDGGRTWHFTKALPNPDAYPYCTTNSAGVPQSMIAWGRDGTLYSAHNAYGEGEGQGAGQGRVSIVLARSTDLGAHWSMTLVDNNRGKTDVPPSDDGVTGLVVDASGSRDVVHVGFNQSFPDAPTGSPLRNPIVMVATSTDGGATFPPPVNLNTFPLPTQTIAGKSYNLYMRSSFGSPFLVQHGATLLAVAGPDTGPTERPTPPPEAGAGLTPGSWYSYPMPQLVARSTDQGKTWTIKIMGPPIYAGNGSFTGLGWTPKGGSKGTFVAAYGGTPETSPTTGIANVVVQRSTDDGQTWSEPLAVNDESPDLRATSFYPQLAVAPNGRVDVSFQDNRETTDFNFNVRYTYSTDGGATWAPNVKINDRPVNFNYGVSFNSDIRQPGGVAATDQYAVLGWADT